MNYTKPATASLWKIKKGTIDAHLPRLRDILHHQRPGGVQHMEDDEMKINELLNRSCLLNLEPREDYGDQEVEICAVARQLASYCTSMDRGGSTWYYMAASAGDASHAICCRDVDNFYTLMHAADANYRHVERQRTTRWPEGAAQMALYQVITACWNMTPRKEEEDDTGH